MIKYTCSRCSHEFANRREFDFHSKIAPAGCHHPTGGAVGAVPTSEKSTPIEGLKFDQDKPAMGLIPAEALEEEGRVWAFGAKKYQQWNWTKGLVYTRILGALMRHTAAIMRGEDRDAETGLLHAAHIRCCAAMLIKFQLGNRTDLDDRINAPNLTEIKK